MKKLNNKGFLLVETIVVATFTLTVLIALFIQFKNLLVSYSNSYNYNTVEGVYNLNNIKTYITQYQASGNSLSKQLQTKINSGGAPYLLIYSQSSGCNTNLSLGDIDYCNTLTNSTTGNFKQIIFTDSNSKKIKEYINTHDDSNITEEMRNIIKQLDNVENQNRLIAEYQDNTAATIVFGVKNA